MKESGINCVFIWLENKYALVKVTDSPANQFQEAKIPLSWKQSLFLSLVSASWQQLKLFRSFSIFSCLSPFLPVFCWWCFSLQLDQRERLADSTVAAGAGFATVQEKRGWTEARGGGEGSADRSHARKKSFTSSLRPQAPADYHRHTVGSFPPPLLFVFWIPPHRLFVPVNKRSMDSFTGIARARKTNKQTGTKHSSDAYRCSGQNAVIVNLSSWIWVRQHKEKLLGLLYSQVFHSHVGNTLGICQSEISIRKQIIVLVDFLNKVTK